MVQQREMKHFGYYRADISGHEKVQCFSFPIIQVHLENMTEAPRYHMNKYIEVVCYSNIFLFQYLTLLICSS